MAAKEYHETNIVVSSIGMAATPPAAPSSPATCPPLRTPTKNPSRLDLFVFFSSCNRGWICEKTLLLVRLRGGEHVLSLSLSILFPFLSFPFHVRRRLDGSRSLQWPAQIDTQVYGWLYMIFFVAFAFSSADLGWGSKYARMNGNVSFV